MPGGLHPAEVLLHLGVQEILVDGRELGRELLVQELKYPLVSAHPLTLTSGNWLRCGNAADRRELWGWWDRPPICHGGTWTRGGVEAGLRASARSQAVCSAFSGHCAARSP